MNNLKKPLFWAYAVLVSYTILQLIIRLIISSSSIGSKLSLAFLVVSLCIVFVFVSRFLPASGKSIAVIGIFLLVISIVMMGSGTSALHDFIFASDPRISSLSLMYKPLLVIAMLPFGVLLFFFSALSIISGIRSKQSVGDSVLDHNG